MNIEKIKEVAKNLILHSDNVEYVRGICELIADLDGVVDVHHADRTLQIADELEVKVFVIRQMY